MAKKVAKKKTAKRVPVDSRGRAIGKRAHRKPPGAGLVNVSAEERLALRAVANRAAEPKDTSAFARAMALEKVGDWDVAEGGSLQSFAMSLSQAKRRGELKGRKFDYGTTTAVLQKSASAPAKYANVLWFIRTK